MDTPKEIEGHEAILRYIRSTRLGSDPTLQIPPSSFSELNGRFLRYVYRRSLSLEFPFDARFLNPTGGYQGGMLGTLVDNGFGFLSYLSAEHPCITLNLNLTYIRGFHPDDAFVTVDTVMVSRGQTFLTMQATVKNPKDKVVATAISQLQIAKPAHG